MFSDNNHILIYTIKFNKKGENKLCQKDLYLPAYLRGKTI